MKKILIMLLVMGTLLCFTCVSAGAEDAVPAKTEHPEKAEWTVMFYFCGSDLESKYSYASENIMEIKGVHYPDSLLPVYGMVDILGDDFDWPKSQNIQNRVNILMETGGSKKWNLELMDVSIRNDVLQRWKYEYLSLYSDVSLLEKTGFSLQENCQLASMADPATLTDYIRWSAENFPAEKYALVLWDHGGGALTGLMTDELFDNDIMYLYELKQALGDSGIQLEALLIDACLMANVETAWAVKDSAHWMIASEELVPGKGTAIKEWLQELLNFPECDGRQLGRMICDLTQSRYSKDENKNAASMLTWSVIDLTKIEKLAEPLERFMKEITEAFRKYPMAAINFARMFNNAEEYGDGKQKMRDLASVFYDENAVSIMDISMRNKVLDALSEIVVYTVRGSAHTSAKGLSFCYPIDADADTLDIYALNCPSKWYLAYLDAITYWKAPDSVYETAEHFPEINTIEDFRITAHRVWTEDGFPAFKIDNILHNVSGCYYTMFYKDEDTNQLVCLGRTSCRSEAIVGERYEEINYAYEPWSWPMIEGVPCSTDLLMEQYNDKGILTLYTIPVQIGTETYYFRCGRQDFYADLPREYEIYGAWNGDEEEKQMVQRGVTSIVQLSGREYRILWPLEEDWENDGKEYIPGSGTLRIPRTIEIAEGTLPAGTYYLEYEVDDMFLRPYYLMRIEMYWDGKAFSFPEDLGWEGTDLLNWDETLNDPVA